MLNIISKISRIRNGLKSSLGTHGHISVTIENIVEEHGSNPDVGLDLELAFRGLLEEFLLNQNNIKKPQRTLILYYC